MLRRKFEAVKTNVVLELEAKAQRQQQTMEIKKANKARKRKKKGVSFFEMNCQSDSYYVKKDNNHDNSDEYYVKKK